MTRDLVAAMIALSIWTSAIGLAGADPVVAPWRFDPPTARPRVVVSVGSTSVVATVARTSAESALGLGYRDRLAPGTGMLFVYDEPVSRSFWMKGMRICLDIIWIEGDQIVGAAEAVCPSPFGTLDADLPRFQSPVPVRYVLEVNAGWMAANGLGTGSPVRFDPDPLPPA